MKPLSERLNDQLEKRVVFPYGKPLTQQQFRTPAPWEKNDPEIDTLVELAQRLQQAGPLQIDPTFARLLEDRLQVHHASQLRKRAASTRRNWRFSARLSIQIALGVVVLCLLLGSGVLAAAASVDNPTNPLYTVKLWEHHVQHTFTTSAVARTELDTQMIHEQLNMLETLADPSHATAYQRALADLQQQMNATSQAIDALPAGQDRSRLSSEFQRLKADARHTLRSVLPRLNMSERLMTTDELGLLGDTIPSLKNVTVKLSLHPTASATISISGNDLQSGLQLLVDDQLVMATGSYQDGVYVFVVDWTGKQTPKTIGILNPDGTATHTTTIASTISNGNSSNGKNSGNDNGGSKGNPGNGNGGNNGHGHSPGSGNGAGKPTGTPGAHS